MTVNFEKDIPIPNIGYWAPIMRMMKVGDSLLVPVEREKQRVALYVTAKTAGIKITLRSTDEGLRMWRVS